MSIKLTPTGRLLWESSELIQSNESKKIKNAFANSSAEGLFFIAGKKLSENTISPSVIYWRDFTNKFLTAICHSIQNISPNELDEIAQSAPPMTGIEYLRKEVLETLWEELAAFAEKEISKIGLSEWIKSINPLIHLVGRVTFHLAENKRNENFPFAFMATYTNKISNNSKLQYLPLGKALEEYSKNKSALVSLLSPVKLASEKSPLVKNLVDKGEIYHPRAWTPQNAYNFLKEIPLFEDAGIIVRVPDWWKKKQPPRPKIKVTIGDTRKSSLGIASMLDFSIKIVLDGEEISINELKKINIDEDRKSVV